MLSRGKCIVFHTHFCYKFFLEVNKRSLLGHHLFGVASWWYFESFFSFLFIKEKWNKSSCTLIKKKVKLSYCLIYKPLSHFKEANFHIMEHGFWWTFQLCRFSQVLLHWCCWCAENQHNVESFHVSIDLILLLMVTGTF